MIFRVTYFIVPSYFISGLWPAVRQSTVADYGLFFLIVGIQVFYLPAYLGIW